MAVLRDVAISIIAIEAFVFTLVPIILLGALVYGTGWLRRHENLPSWLKPSSCSFLSLGLVVTWSQSIAFR